MIRKDKIFIFIILILLLIIPLFFVTKIFVSEFGTDAYAQTVKSVSDTLPAPEKTTFISEQELNDESEERECNARIKRTLYSSELKRDELNRYYSDKLSNGWVRRIDGGDFLTTWAQQQVDVSKTVVLDIDLNLVNGDLRAQTIKEANKTYYGLYVRVGGCPGAVN